jgi:hypothetical protein
MSGLRLRNPGSIDPIGNADPEPRWAQSGEPFSRAASGYIIAARCTMNIQLPMHMDKAAFLAWAEGRQEHYGGWRPTKRHYA